MKPNLKTFPKLGLNISDYIMKVNNWQRDLIEELQQLKQSINSPNKLVNFHCKQIIDEILGENPK